MSTVKEEAKRLIATLPDQATWDDIMYEFYVKKKFEKALEEAAPGDVISHESAKRELASR